MRGSSGPSQDSRAVGGEEKQRLPHPQPFPGAPGPGSGAEALCTPWAAGMLLGSIHEAWVSGRDKIVGASAAC